MTLRFHNVFKRTTPTTTASSSSVDVDDGSDSNSSNNNSKMQAQQQQGETVSNRFGASYALNLLFAYAKVCVRACFLRLCVLVCLHQCACSNYEPFAVNRTQSALF